MPDSTAAFLGRLAGMSVWGLLLLLAHRRAIKKGQSRTFAWIATGTVGFGFPFAVAVQTGQDFNWLYPIVCTAWSAAAGLAKPDMNPGSGEAPNDSHS